MNYVQTSVQERIGILTLSHTEKRNALSPEMVKEFKDSLRFFSVHKVRAVIVKSMGPVFCSGADLSYLQQMQRNSYEENLADSQNLKELFHMIYTYDCPVIAQVEGPALAGGCGLVSVCDFVFAIPNAQFSFTEVRIGFVPAIVSVFLIKRMGKGKAKEMLLSGNSYDASEAIKMGLVNFIVDADRIDEQVKTFVLNLIRKNSGHAMEVTKKIINEFADMSLQDALEEASRINAHVRNSADCQRGIQAFLSKEKIEW